MEPAIANLRVSDPKVAAELLLANHVAATLLANAVPDAESGIDPAERHAIALAVGTMLGEHMLELRIVLERQFPQFKEEAPGQVKRALRAAGAGDQALWEWFDA